VKTGSIVGVGVPLAADSRPVLLGIGPPFGTLDQIYLSLLFSTDNYFYLFFSYGILSDEKTGL
jgi:hypothetical protein